MNDALQYHPRPARSSQWKQRPGFPPRSNEPLAAEPTSYGYQVDLLKECLIGLRNKKNLVESGKNSYLEVGFFIKPEEFTQEHLEQLAQDFGIGLRKSESLGEGSKIHFYISDLNKLLLALKKAIDDFDAFRWERIPKEKVTFKRIALWRHFRLSTQETKNELVQNLDIEPFEGMRLKVDFIEEIPQFASIVASAAAKAGLEAQPDQYGIISLTNLRDKAGKKVSEFASYVTDYDQIEYIRLDDFVCTIEAPLLGGPVEQTKYRIQEIDAAAPVVAVIDSVVQRTALTKPFLTPDGLDFVDDPNDPTVHPFYDNCGHGTAVACEIAYGPTIVQYLADQEVDYLIPLVKIFPVRVAKGESFNAPYDRVFDPKGTFAQAVERYNIRIVNVSFSGLSHKEFESEHFSMEAALIDRFAKELGVLVVVSVGNIGLKTLEELASRFPDLSFYQRTRTFCNVTADRGNKAINISGPSDLFSGITTGSCYLQPKKKKHVVSSFNRSFAFKNPRNSYSKPDVVAIGGGDFPIDLRKAPPKFCDKSGRVQLVFKEENLLRLSAGTSFSAPRVARALAIGLIKYPDLSPEGLKCLFLHKANSYRVSSKKWGQDIVTQDPQEEYITFHDSLKGHGALFIKNETELWSDSDDEISIVMEGEIEHETILSFRVPIVRMLGDGSGKNTNKIQLKLSIASFPWTETTALPRTMKQANRFHVAALAHVNSLMPTYTVTRSEGRITYRDQCIPSATDGVLIGWTSDYQGSFFPTFSLRSKEFRKDDLMSLIGQDDHITLSVRGLVPENGGSKARFAMVFSLKDLGGTADIRNKINIRL